MKTAKLTYMALIIFAASTSLATDIQTKDLVGKSLPIEQLQKEIQLFPVKDWSIFRSYIQLEGKIASEHKDPNNLTFTPDIGFLHPVQNIFCTRGLEFNKCRSTKRKLLDRKIFSKEFNAWFSQIL